MSTYCVLHTVGCKSRIDMFPRYCQCSLLHLPPDAYHFSQKPLTPSATVLHTNVMLVETGDSDLFFMTPRCLAR